MTGYGILLPVIAGLAAGIGIVIIFGIIFVPEAATTDNSVAIERTWVSYEPTKCSTPPWISHWTRSNPNNAFQLLAEEEQYKIIKDYYREQVGITVFDVLYRWSQSPSCLACGCSVGYIIDFQVNDGDATKLREDILKTTVPIEQDTI
ncbi:MAG: hypothetical protein AB1351_00670 [Thermoproteota archaeon]